MLGPAPILDFDGTIADLTVDWRSVRRVLGVRTIDELWSRSSKAWALVTESEVAAAGVAEPVECVVSRLERVRAFAVLTANTERAVEVFLRRYPALSAKTTCIVGRETLGGPKREFSRFGSGFAMCVQATSSARGPNAVVYLGDHDYELEFAARLGAVARRVDDLRAAWLAASK